MQYEFRKKFSYYIIKRIIDFCGALCGILVLSPIFLLVSIAIKIDSKGPVIFSQTRVGQDDKKFKMYKFRSMIVNAEELLDRLKEKNEMSGPMFKIKNDPRITRVGRVIRKTSLDELPQLINVLKGEMALVGPRPSLPHEVAQLTEYQKQRLIAKPGLTCYWQISGRNDLGFEEWMNMDIKYLRDRSIWLDIKLIFKTIKILFKHNGAY